MDPSPTSQLQADEADGNGEQPDKSLLRRSRRASSASIRPDMIPTPSDSRARATKPQSQKRPPAPSSESGESIVTGKTPRKTKAKAAKKPRQVVSSGAAGATEKGDLAAKKTPKRKTNNTVPDKTKEATAQVPDTVNYADEAYDYDQVLDDGSVKIQSGKTKEKKEIKEKFANVADYFHEPYFKDGEREKGDVPVNYKCKWCHKTYRGHGSTDGNLTMHRDGSNQAGRNAKGCPNRNEAKAAGVKLPPSIAEKRLIDAKQAPMSSFLQPKPVFVNRVLNQIIMIWQIRHALPWYWIEDCYLRAAFLYANPKALLYGKQWSADESKKLYLGLKATVFDDLKKLNTKFTLIHDVWTTKGNRFAFIGAAVAYIDSDWNYVVRHLALKMIPWKHQGNLLARPIAALLKKHNLYKKMLAQTTDSGSNNNTMASTMYQLLKNSDAANQSEHAWDPASMHIRCFCHKLALIVNSGLNALSLKTLPPGKAKESVLGFFPVLGKVLEEDEAELFEVAPEVELAPAPSTKTNSVEPDPEQADDDKDWQSDYGNADKLSDDEAAAAANEKQSDYAAESADDSASQSQHTKTVKLKELLTKLDVVIKQITRSAAQRANFDRVAKELNLKVAPLIAGYGIRWNIKYQSYRKAIDAREVIDHLLKEDQGSNQPGYFDDVFFIPRDWNEIEKLDRELEVFVDLTSQMEGNHSSGSHVIPRYLELKDQLSEKLHRSNPEDALYPMFYAMIPKVDKYLDEAMACETLVLATILHPCYRMLIFELGFGSESSEVANCLDLLNRRFEIYKTEKNSNTQPSIPKSEVVEIKRPHTAEPQSLRARLALRMAKTPTPHEDEVEAYLQATKGSYVTLRYPRNFGNVTTPVIRGPPLLY
ncbi:hypothetical protein PTTG_26415 [Puccinia triticina 1-1 BBBD Race 1]|uniref:BED-type domain-containing protein n=1 Tax=Puccinia triticina (isolate 1-1 / race 1 (BBBD)) TaxID=630390 RepID=A0A180GW41_PUCT1|nr:hypothetical protein PTTG_26415 [Puccinia triticina 1-1 BBBD Race 1]